MYMHYNNSYASSMTHRNLDLHKKVQTSTLNGLLFSGFSFKQNAVMPLTLAPLSTGCNC